MMDWGALDRQLSGRATALVGSPAGRWAAQLLAHSGDSQWWLAAGALFWWQGQGDWREVGMRVVVVTLAGGLASGLFKHLIRRPRPDVGAHGRASLLYFSFDRHSFPSGHATRVGGLVVVLGALAPAGGALALALWGAAVGVSRVALGVHFAGDIAAGLLLGALLGVVLLVCWL